MSYHEIFKTIPIPGEELIRDTKTLKKHIKYKDGTLQPFKPTTWETKQTPANILLANAGESNIIAIDFDGPEGDHYFHKAIQLDPDCKYIAKGIGKGGGHLIYKTGNTTVLDDNIASENGCNIQGLDLQRGRKLILLATPANKTKQLLTEPINNYDELTEMPESVQLLVSNIYLKHQQTTTKHIQGTNESTHRDSKLYHIVKDVTANPEEYHHKFFNIITTPKYKAIMKKHNKHPDYPYIPDNLPMSESANQYLVSVGTILGRDPSIDIDTFNKAMTYVNSLFSAPYGQADFELLCNYITSGKSQIDGVSVWQYNQDWAKTGMLYSEHSGDSHEVFQFTNKGQIQYIDHNHITNDVTIYATAGHLLDYIKAVSTTSVNKERLLKRVNHVKTVSDPLLAFGATGKTFNLYKRTEELDIFMDPEQYKTEYSHPTVTLKALENSMGYDRLYKFFLPFWKRKITTREFSPLILVLYGPPHSGKSFIPNGVLAPLVKGRNQTLSPEILTEKYNDWKLNKDIVFVDEIHNMAPSLRTQVIGTMNTVSGSGRFTDIRAMQQTVSSEEYPNYITFIVACNDVVQLVSEVQDRRTVILRSRQKLSDALGMGDDEIADCIMSETKDFAYFLATEVTALPRNLYVNNNWLKDADYKEFHSESLPFDKALVQTIDKLDWNGLESLLSDNSVDRLELASCCQLTKTEVQVRLFNTHEHDTHYPSVTKDMTLNINSVMRLLKQVRDTDKTKIKWKVYDTKDGEKKLNKKTVAVFPLNAVPADFLDLLKTSEQGIQPIGD